LWKVHAPKGTEFSQLSNPHAYISTCLIIRLRIWIGL
jgi:hypothetical protein